MIYLDSRCGEETIDLTKERFFFFLFRKHLLDQKKFSDLLQIPISEDTEFPPGGTLFETFEIFRVYPLNVSIGL